MFAVRVRQFELKVAGTVGGQNPGTAAIGDDGEPCPAGPVRKDLGGGEQLAESLTRTAPARSSAASKTSSEPISAPVWVLAAFEPYGGRLSAR